MMAALPKAAYLVTACFMVANGMPRNIHKNLVSKLDPNNGGSANTVSQSHFTTYTSYGTFANFDFSDLQYRLNSMLFNMLQNFKNNFPLIFINPRNVFSGYFPPDLVGSVDNPNVPRTPKYFPTTNRVYRPTPPYPTAASNRPTMKPIPSSKTTPAVAVPNTPTVPGIPNFPSRGSEEAASEPKPEDTTVIDDTEDDDDDNTRPIVLKDPSTLRNEVSDPTERRAPNVEHGSVQAGS